MGMNDAAEMLEVAKAECERLEAENAGLAAAIERVRAILDAPVAPYGDPTVPTWTERESLSELYADEFVDRLDAILATSPTDALEAVKADAWTDPNPWLYKNGSRTAHELPQMHVTHWPRSREQYEADQARKTTESEGK